MKTLVISNRNQRLFSYSFSLHVLLCIPRSIIQVWYFESLKFRAATEKMLKNLATILHSHTSCNSGTKQFAPRLRWKREGCWRAAPSFGNICKLWVGAGGLNEFTRRWAWRVRSPEVGNYQISTFVNVGIFLCVQESERETNKQRDEAGSLWIECLQKRKEKSPRNFG